MKAINLEARHVLLHSSPFSDPLDSMHAYARMKKDNFSFFILGAINYEKREEIINETSAMLGVSKRTLYNWCKEGELKYVRLPSGHKRYFGAEIEAILKNNK